MLTKLGDHPFMQYLKAKRERIEAWAAENPELAEAWTDALSEDTVRSRNSAEKRQALERRVEGLRAAGVPERLRERLSFRSTVDDTVARRATKQLHTTRPILLLCGSPGCGKTFAAVAAMAEALENSATPSALFVKAFELSRLSNFAPEDKRRLSDLSRSRFLVLDDLGAEMLHDGLRPMLDELIDARYQTGSRTILTTNLDPTGFKTRYGERISDRIREMGRVVSCGDKSLRRPNE